MNLLKKNGWLGLKSLYHIVGLCILLSLFTPLKGQEFTVNVQQFGVEEGLLHRNVVIYKDRKGFIWLASTAGLQRYDGYTFKAYDLPGEENFQITHIGETETGKLWLLYHGTHRDFLFFDPETGEASRKSSYFEASHVATLYDLLNQYELAFLPKNPSDEFYFQGEGKIIAFSFNSGSYEIPMPRAKYFQIQAITENGELWVGIKRTDYVRRLDVHASLPDNWNWTPQTSHTTCLLNGELYVLKGWTDDEKLVSELYKYSPAGESHLVYRSNSGYLLSQILDNRAWAIGKAGWQVIDLTTNEHIELLQADYGPELFGYMGYRIFFSDGPDRVYTCGPFGFNIIDIQPNLFTTYFNDNSDFELPFNNSIRGIYAEEDQLFFYCENQGLVRQNPKDPTDFNIIFNQSSLIEEEKAGLNLLRTTQGDIWIPKGRYLNHYNSQFQLQERFDFGLDIDPKDTWNLKSWVVFEDFNHCIWTADHLGLARTCDGQVERFSYQPATLNPGILQILQKDASTLWLCSEAGLLEFDMAAKKITHTYASDQEGEYQLPATNIKSMLVEENGDKWLTSDRGLIYWSAATGEKRLFNRLDGLSNNNLYAVYPDKHNRLWLSSDYGIMSFDKASHHVITYLPKDGIGQEEFNRIAHFQDANGRIYFGGLNGVTAFHPDDFLAKKEEHSNMVLSELELFDGQLEALTNQLPAVNNHEPIHFKPADRYLKLSFSLPTFEDTEKNLYAWKIEGVFDEWNYQKENFLQFAALPYGNHTLRIKGQSSASGWSPHELAIRINVLKPFYLKAWFLLLSLLALIMGTIGFFSYRTRLLRREITKATQTIQQQTEELRQLDELKSRFFANVSHELRTPLALMLGPIKRLIKKGNRDKTDQQLLSFLERNTLHLKGLLNEILDLSKLENNKMEVREEPTLIKSYLAAHLSQYYSIGNSERIYVTGEIELADDLNIYLDQNKFEKVINNFLSNAIKFTHEEGQVALHAETAKNELVISVTDNGRGIDPKDLPYVFDRFYQSKVENAPTEGGTGIGLSMCKELADLMHGKVWAESTLGKGSTFYFSFPLKLAKEVAILTETMPADITLKPLLGEREVGKDIATLRSKKNAIKSATILVVEDNADLRAYYQIILGDFKVAMTEHGQQALDYLAVNDAPDLIISDLMMPVMDGMQLLNHLKSSDHYRHIPVVMLTAKTNRQVKIQALRYGIDDYVNKPFDDEELLARIGNLLENRAGRSIVDEEESGNKQQKNTVTESLDQVSQADVEWLEQLENYILNNLSNDLLSINLIAHHFAMSESTLLRQLKRIAGLTPNKYLQEIRLNRALELLQRNTYKSVAEVAYRVGFRDASSFARSFKRRFGKSPSELFE